jgi:hypothetical protein
LRKNNADMCFEVPKVQQIILLYCLVIEVIENVRQLRGYVTKQALLQTPMPTPAVSLSLSLCHNSFSSIKQLLAIREEDGVSLIFKLKTLLR